MATKTKRKQASGKKPTKKAPTAKKAAKKKSAAGKKRAAKVAKKATKPAAKKAAKPATKKAAKPAAQKAAKPAAQKAAKPAAQKAAKPAAQRATKPHKPRVRRDATGHLDPNYARDLRRLSRENQEHDDDRAFLVGQRREDALAAELGREFVETVTSGEDEGVELRDEDVPEEIGGPFVITTAGKEFADEPDESNPVDATREPFPKS
jgi:hypothetical protein